jgi:hypothetical protein
MATTHSDLAVRLLRDAATFFEAVGEQNPPLKEPMDENAEVFREVAELVNTDPTGVLRDDDELKNMNGRFP